MIRDRKAVAPQPPRTAWWSVRPPARTSSTPDRGTGAPGPARSAAPATGTRWRRPDDRPPRRSGPLGSAPVGRFCSGQPLSGIIRSWPRRSSSIPPPGHVISSPPSTRGASAPSRPSATCSPATASSRCRPPAFERLEVLTGKYGDEGDKLIFKILRRGEHEATGEADLALRYDLTVPLARAAAAYGSQLPSPYKRYAIAPVWRADRPGKGRFREFVQCDLDIVGSSSPLSDAEVDPGAARRPGRTRRTGVPIPGELPARPVRPVGGVQRPRRPRAWCADHAGQARQTLAG